mmetsp:Transcript_17219/g.42972  ORF Transcript_17219/g.42972 Transcript_17219/m.42972 type:complete len:241 (-) Transcript_17219:57-779(-)
MGFGLRPLVHVALELCRVEGSSFLVGHFCCSAILFLGIVSVALCFDSRFVGRKNLWNKFLAEISQPCSPLLNPWCFFFFQRPNGRMHVSKHRCLIQLAESGLHYSSSSSSSSSIIVLTTTAIHKIAVGRNSGARCLVIEDAVRIVLELLHVLFPFPFRAFCYSIIVSQDGLLQLRLVMLQFGQLSEVLLEEPSHKALVAVERIFIFATPILCSCCCFDETIVVWLFVISTVLRKESPRHG